MDNSGIYLGLDVGTTSIKAIIGRRERNGDVLALGVANVASNGVKNGAIVNIDETAQAINEAIVQAQNKARVSINEVVIGIPANQLDIMLVQGQTAVKSPDKRIEYADIQAVAENAIAGLQLEESREVIDLIPDQFIVDGFDGIDDPHDMVGVNLEMQGTVYVGPRTIVENLRMAVQKAGFVVREFVLTPIALAATMLSDVERENGAAIVDMGGGQSSATVIRGNKLNFAYLEPKGGYNATRDVATVLKLAPVTAEKIKRSYGFADSQQASATNEFTVKTTEGEQVPYSEQYLAQVIEARLEEILDQLNTALTQVSGKDLPGGISITGGVSATPRFGDLANRIFEHRVRLWLPNQIGTRHPAFSRAYSYVVYAAKESMTQEVVKHALNVANTNVNVASINSENATSTANRYNQERKYSAAEDENQSSSGRPTLTEKPKAFIEKMKKAFHNFFN